MKTIRIMALSLLMCLLFRNNIFADVINSNVIEKTKMIAGEKITLNTEGFSQPYSVKWFIGNVQNSKNVQPDNSFKLDESMYENWISVEIDDSKNTYKDKVYFSKLPVVYIDTENNATIVSKDDYINTNIYIQGNEFFDNQYDGLAEIKGRGNTTWDNPKKPYKIKLDSKTDLFGFGKNKHWVLLANYLDNSLLRNKTAYDMSKQLGLESMDSVWIDVVLNGEYVGNYQLCEHIRIDENRINISNIEDTAETIGKAIYKANKTDFNSDTNLRDEMIDEMCEDLSWIDTGIVKYKDRSYTIKDYYEEDIDITGGYIFELSDEYDEVSKFLTNKGMKVMVNSPEFAFTSNKMQEYCVSLWNDFEEAYSSKNGYNSKGQHYSEIGDIDSMTSYYLLNDVLGNNDAYYKSRFAYIDTGGKITFGPVWDFDYGCGNFTVGYNPTGWIIKYGFPFKYWIQDPYFINILYEKYWEYHNIFESYFVDGGILDQNIEYLKESGKANDKRWNGQVSFEEDVEIFKSFLKERLVWLDKQFESLDSIVKSLNSGSTIKSNFVDCFVEQKNEIVNLKIKSKNISIPNSQVNVYINGIKQSTTTDDGYLSINITSYFVSSDDIFVTVISNSGLVYYVPIEKIDNHYVEKVFYVEKEPTCSETGLKYAFSIENDGNTRVYKTIPTIPHTVVIDKEVPATYISTGLTEGSHCSVCHQVLSKQEIIPVLEAKDYKISYELNGGINNTNNPTTYNPLSSSFTLLNPTKQNYTFLGWYENNVLVKVIPQYSSGDKVLVAKWKIDDDKSLLLSNGLSKLSDVYMNGILFGNISSNTIINRDNNVITSYSYKNDDGSDRHLNYPISMNVFLLDDNHEGRKALETNDFNNILSYAGTSIRITGKKGIRVITSIPTVIKNSLITNGINGYKVMEYGTIMCWASDLKDNEEPLLIKNQDGTYTAKYGAKGRAYSRTDNIYAVYKESGGITKYTNTLVGEYTNEQCANDFAVRPYIILRPNGLNNTSRDVVIYGGTIYRSISYVAYQNRNDFNPGTSAYEYIWSLIRAGYGDKYDNEYKNTY